MKLKKGKNRQLKEQYIHSKTKLKASYTEIMLQTIKITSWTD